MGLKYKQTNKQINELSRMIEAHYDFFTEIPFSPTKTSTYLGPVCFNVFKNCFFSLLKKYRKHKKNILNLNNKNMPLRFVWFVSFNTVIENNF